MPMTKCLDCLNFLKRHHLFNNFLHNWCYKKSGWEGYGESYNKGSHPDKNKIIY